MITITCNCGQTSKTFLRLTEAAFPNGWQTDCCVEAEAVMEADAVEADFVGEDPAKREDEVEAWFAALPEEDDESPEFVEEVVAEPVEEAPVEEAPAEPKPATKKTRGRKAKNK